MKDSKSKDFKKSTSKGGKYKGKGGTARGKTSSTFSAQEKDIRGTIPETNDWRWYALDENMLSSVGRIPFNFPLGVPVDTDSASSVFTADDADAPVYQIPGVMRINYIPTFGTVTKRTHPVNVCAQNAFATITHANSRSPGYNAADLFMSIVAMSEWANFWSYLVKVYGYAQKYQTLNRYVPYTIAHALGVDFDDIQHNLSDFRAFINLYARKFNATCCVLKNFPLVQRKMWLNSYIFADGLGTKVQYYVPFCRGYYQFRPYDKETGTSLSLQSFGDPIETGRVDRNDIG